jgi:hypothetical protein
MTIRQTSAKVLDLLNQIEAELARNQINVTTYPATARYPQGYQKFENSSFTVRLGITPGITQSDRIGDFR